MTEAETKKIADKALVGLAGEYHVLAQLAERGYVGALTLGHTKGVNILVTNPRSGTVRKVEVKTTRRVLARHRVFGACLFYSEDRQHERPPAAVAPSMGPIPVT
jgi:hypothetical protein